MWYKSTLALTVLIALFFLSSRNSDQLPFLNRSAPLTRSASDVVMFERKRDTGQIMVISARKVVETQDQVANLKDFSLRQHKGLNLTGTDATYDRTSSVLQVTGPVSIDTTDGTRARLDGLIWDIRSKKASTNNPVTLEGKDGTIAADRAQFSDDFTQIALIGSVHAKIFRNILNH